APPVRARRLGRAARFALALTAILAALFGVPWWTLVGAAQWPGPAVVGGTTGFAAVLVAFPALMVAGHGPRHLDWAARAGDTILGVVWVLFTWSVIGDVLGLALFGLGEPLRSRTVAVGVGAVCAVLMGWGYVEAMRVPRIRRVDVPIDRLG